MGTEHTYEAWRITHQSSEQAARAAYFEMMRLRRLLADATRKPDEAAPSSRLIPEETQ